jgi:hypothetical protein
VCVLVLACVCPAIHVRVCVRRSLTTIFVQVRQALSSSQGNATIAANRLAAADLYDP